VSWPGGVRGGRRGEEALRVERVLGFGGWETWAKGGARPNWERFAERNSVVGRGEDGVSVGYSTGEAGGWFSLLLEDDRFDPVGLSVGLLLETGGERLSQRDFLYAGEHRVGGVKGMAGGITFWFWCMFSGLERRIIELVPEGSAVLEVTTSFSQE